MTADSSPLPGESLPGRHRPARLQPLGVELHHLIARAGYREQSLPHAHHGAGL